MQMFTQPPTRAASCAAIWSSDGLKLKPEKACPARDAGRLSVVLGHHPGGFPNGFLGECLGLVFCKKFVEPCERQGRRDEVALPLLDAAGHQRIDLRAGFDAL